MAKNPGPNRPFRSRFGGGFVDAAQYVAEEMCKRRARTRGQSLGPRFWTTPGWSREFHLQAQLANNLAKVYSFDALLAALRDPRGQRLYSLKAHSLNGLLKEAQHKVDVEAARPKDTVAAPVEKPARPAAPYQAQKTLWETLREE
jgi:hypothetical protein